MNWGIIRKIAFTQAFRSREIFFAFHTQPGSGSGGGENRFWQEERAVECGVRCLSGEGYRQSFLLDFYLVRNYKVQCSGK
jgi:hypothetical protein